MGSGLIGYGSSKIRADLFANRVHGSGFYSSPLLGLSTGRVWTWTRLDSYPISRVWKHLFVTRTRLPVYPFDLAGQV